MIPERRRFADWNMGRIIKVGVTAISVSMVVLAVVYVVFRVQEIAKLQLEFAALHAETQALNEQHFALIKHSEYRLDELERELFGEVLVQLQKQKDSRPNRVEIWQANTARELRERMSRVEKRLMQVEEAIR
jgi:hypothetical protein